MQYDYIVKTNTSTYINIKLLNEIINLTSKEVGKEEKVTEIDKDKNLGDERGNKADKRQLRNGKQRSVRTNDEK